MSPKGTAVASLNAITPRNRLPDSPAASVAVASIASEDSPFVTSWTPSSSTPVASPAKRRRQTNESSRPSFRSISQTAGSLSYHERAHSFVGSSPVDSLRAASFSEPGVHQTNFSSPSQSQITPDAEVPPPGVWTHTSVQEACLMRYFIDELACWVCQVPTSRQAHRLTL